MVVRNIRFKKREVIRAMDKYVFTQCNSICLEVSDEWNVKVLENGDIELGIPDGCEEEKEGN